MALVGIIAKKKNIKELKKKLGDKYEVVDITNESVKNFKNIKFEEIICNKVINLTKEEYKFMREIINKTKYVIVNSDIEIKFLKNINMEKPIKIITFGFNQKSTLSISSIKEDYIIISVQRDIEKINKQKIENQERKIEIVPSDKISIYSQIINFIVRELNEE